MPDIISQAQPAVAALENRDTDDLYKELGRRLYAIQDDFTISASFSPKINTQLESQGVADDLGKFGQIFFERVNVQAYQLICGSQSQDSSQRQQVLDAFGVNRATVGAAIASLLIVQLGLAPAIATVVAALILRTVFQPAYEAMCEVWSEKLPKDNKQPS